MVGEDIFRQAVSQLREQTGISAKKVPPGGRAVDARIQLKRGKEMVEFICEIKNELRSVHLPGLMELNRKRRREPLLVISQYIPKPLKEGLKGQGISYLEASGNCFINHGNLYVYINDQAVTPTRLPQEGKLWKTAGLKFLFLILQYPDMLNTSYRVLAGAADIALGNIGPLIEELKEEGYAKSGADGKLFIENKPLLQKKWVELFVSVMRPKLKLGNFRFMDEASMDHWKTLPHQNFLWGGEAAGALLTNHLKPQELTLYTSHSKVQLMKDLKMVPAKDGPVELMEIFWNEESFEAQERVKATVPPLVAYAELAASMDSRNRETAERIKEKYLEDAG